MSRLVTFADARRVGDPTSAGRFMRLPDVIASTGLSRPTIYRLIAESQFPEQHRLTKRSVGWWEADIEEWLQSRRTGTSEPA